ncbi:MAG: LLM class flavin-dependent oxidoreductase [Alphaproteobacteria bacterium]|nr:LLM class flavin-dependent oxidoreductase [Alphaproteobacteria bacterium]MCB9929390.1 LLM class flavin-dependent oxidoreductase [Alphaproteobacteria bacterium]
MSAPDLTFGWFLPTSGDSTNLGDPKARIPQSPELFDEIVDAVDRGGFRYMLLPVNAFCWEATVMASYYIARTRTMAPLIALRAGYANPVLSAKIFATLDQMSRGRLCINLIAGINDDDTHADGLFDSKQVRYEKMDEEVEIMKRLWAASEPIGYKGKHYQVDTVMQPTAYQKPHPPFFLGGGSDQALEISAKHSTVHLFWGDRPSGIAEKVKDIRARAEKYGRADHIQFGMRLQIVCEETEDQAWEAAYRLIDGATRFNLANMRAGQNSADGIRRTSEANRQVWKLLEESGNDMKIHPHLWTGISTVRSGAGIAVVGNPEQVAATLQEFVDAGCTSFCLSGYPHARMARVVSERVMPYFQGRLADSIPQAA